MQVPLMGWTYPAVSNVGKLPDTLLHNTAHQGLLQTTYCRTKMERSVGQSWFRGCDEPDGLPGPVAGIL